MSFHKTEEAWSNVIRCITCAARVIRRTSKVITLVPILQKKVEWISRIPPHRNGFGIEQRNPFRVCMNR